MRSSSRTLLCLLAAAALAVVAPSAGPSVAGPTPPGERATVTGTAVVDRSAPAARIVRPASLTRTAAGYYYSAWGNHNRITVTLVDGRLHFRDPRPARWEDVARACRRIRVDRGIAASCRVPAGVTPAQPLTIAMELRLGNDFVDTTALGPEFRASVLADAGREVVRLGAGDDFVNGAFHRDRIWGGGGADLIRAGEGNDTAHGQGGNDHLLGTKAADVLRGGTGNDLVEGGPGDDRMYGDQGADRLKCGDGRDEADLDPADTQRHACERTAS